MPSLPREASLLWQTAACADVSPTRANASFSEVQLVWLGAHVRDSWQEQDVQREDGEKLAKEVRIQAL